MQIIDLRDFQWALLYAFSLSFATFNIINAIVKTRIKPIFTFIVIFLIKLAVLETSFYIEWLPYKMIAYYLLVGVFIFFASDDKAFTKIFSVILYIISSTLTVLLMGLISGFILYKGTDPIDSFGDNWEFSYYLFEFLFLCIFTVAMSFLFVSLINAIMSLVNKGKSYKLKFSFFLFLPVTHIAMLLLPLALANYNDEMSDYEYATMTIIFIACFLFDFCLIFIIDHFQALEETNIKQQKLILKNQLDYTQTVLLNNEKLELKKLKHDIGNLLTSAEGLIEIGKPEKALAILKSTNADLINTKKSFNSSNDILNTVLYIKKGLCDDEKINFQAKIDESFSININDYDLCRILSNILDNAINAAKNCAEEKLVDVLIEADDESVKIKCKNTFNDIKQHKPKNDGNHGFGIKIIKEIAKKYKGKYTYNTNEKYYLTEVLLENNVKLA